MPGVPVLNVSTLVTCMHGGQAKALISNPRVKVAGVPVVTVVAVYAIAGCSLPPPPAGNGPCVTAAWVPPTAAKRVKAMGLPLLLQTSQALCVPTGTGVIVGVGQARVTAT